MFHGLQIPLKVPADIVTPPTGYYTLFLNSAASNGWYAKDSVGALISLGGGFADPMTTIGDIIIRDATNTTARLGIGAAGTVLTVVGGVPVWQAPGGISDGDKGDIVVSVGGTVWTIEPQAVTLAKIQNISSDRFLGRDTAGVGVLEELGVGTSLEFSGAGTIQRAALTGDVTAAANSNATTIANDAVTYAKMQNISAASRLLGRGSAAGAGDTEEIILGTGLSMSGTTLNASGGSITIGTTTIASGTDTRILYNNAGVVGEYTITGTGTVVAMQTAPTFITNITSPLVIGGTAVGSTLILKSTSAVGTTDAIIFQLGNNGATEYGRMLTSGYMGIGRTTASYRLDLQSATSDFIRITNTNSASSATFDALNNAGVGVSFGATGSTYGTYGALAANNAYMYSSVGFTFMADGGGTVIKWATGGSTERMRLDNSGYLGIGITPSASFLHVKSGTTVAAQITLAPGVAPTAPADGNIYYIDVNDRFMVRKGALDSEIISASAVTTEVVVSDTTLTVTYNGTTYKLLARV